MKWAPRSADVKVEVSTDFEESVEQIKLLILELNEAAKKAAEATKELTKALDKTKAEARKMTMTNERQRRTP